MAGPKSRAWVLLLVWTAACADADRPAGPEPDPEPVVLTLSVNVQLGDTPVGRQPEYILVGQVRATQNSVAVPAFVDSVRVSYRVAGAAWTPFHRYSQFPASAFLPFVAEDGQTYDVRAVLYAHARGADGEIVRDSRERVVSGKGYVPAP